jgi:UDP-N-acetylglucosamine 2-epimerase
MIVYPNSDRGHRGIIQAIERHASVNGDDVRPVRSMPHDDYLRALLHADVLVGNSSSGIIEAPFAGTPSVDVGTRQAGREPGGTSVIHADESVASIRSAIRRALQKRPRRGGRSVYGDGHAGQRIADLLGTLRLTPGLTGKRPVL